MPRRIHRHASLLLAFTSLAVVLLVVAALALTPDPEEQRALGTPGAIVAVTYGNQPLIVGPRWRKWLLPIFPSLAKLGGEPPVSPGVAGADSLVVWERQGFEPGLRPFWDTISLLEMRISDGRGESLTTLEESSRYSFFGSSLLVAYELPNFPRRGKQIRVRTVRGNLTRAEQREVVLNTPHPGTSPVLTPGPDVQRAGELEVYLDAFQSRVRDRRNAEGLSTEGTRLVLQLREHGQPVSDGWAMEKLAISDATGNSWGEDVLRVAGTKEGIVIELRDSLLRQESAYRIQLELARRRRYPPEDLWTVRNIRVPSPGQIVPVDRRARLHGRQFRMTRLYGARAAEKGRNKGEATARVEVDGSLTDFCLRGPLPYWEQTRNSDAKPGYYRVGLGLVRPRQLATVNYALTPIRKVEFLARPAFPK